MGLSRNHFQLNSGRSPVRSRRRPFSSRRFNSPVCDLDWPVPVETVNRLRCGRSLVRCGLTSAWRCRCQAFWVVRSSARHQRRMQLRSCSPYWWSRNPSTVERESHASQVATPINARYMHKNPVVFTPSHLPLLITNHLPKVSDDGPAIWSRLRVIPFDVFIPEDQQDTGLADALRVEADAVLTWSLTGWIEYQKRRLDAPAAVVAATDGYHKDSDAVGEFIADACHLSNQVKVTAGELFDAWERWRKLDGSPEISKKTLGQALDRRGFTSRDSNGKRWWHGLCVLKSEEQ
jgi:hypothetical protein